MLLRGRLLLEVDGGDEVDGSRGSSRLPAEVVLMDEEGHGEPADEVYGDEDATAAQEDGGGDADDESDGDDGKIGVGGVDVEAVEGVDDEQGDAVEGDVEEAVAAGDGDSRRRPS